MVYTFRGPSTSPMKLVLSIWNHPIMERFRHNQICSSLCQSKRPHLQPSLSLCFFFFPFLESLFNLSGWKSDYKQWLGNRANCEIYILMPWRRWACHFMQKVCKDKYLRQRTDWCRIVGYYPHLLLWESLGSHRIENDWAHTQKYWWWFFSC